MGPQAVEEMFMRLFEMQPRCGISHQLKQVPISEIFLAVYQNAFLWP
jgi:hypothetical protein